MLQDGLDRTHTFSPQSTQEILRHILDTDEGKDALEAIEAEAEDLEDSEF